jgi:hypothetical protein
LNCNRITTWNDQSLGFCWSYEGDGCFSTGNRLRITFHLKDRYLANELKKSIGFGNIQKPYNRAVDLLIDFLQNGLQRIIALTNGKFVGPLKLTNF